MTAESSSPFSAFARYVDRGPCGAIWDEEMTKRLARLDLAAEFTREGRSWTEADERGNALVHGGNADA